MLHMHQLMNLRNRDSKSLYYLWVGMGGGGHSREVWVDMCCRGLQTSTLLKTEIAHFATLLRQETLLSDPDLFCFAYRIK